MSSAKIQSHSFHNFRPLSPFIVIDLHLSKLAHKHYIQ